MSSARVAAASTLAMPNGFTSRTIPRQVRCGRWGSPRADGKRDVLHLLIAARDPETGEALAPEAIRDQCATMIFGARDPTVIEVGIVMIADW